MWEYFHVFPVEISASNKEMIRETKSVISQIYEIHTEVYYMLLHKEEEDLNQLQNSPKPSQIPPQTSLHD